MQTRWDSVAVDGGAMRCFVAEPDVTRAPAIVVIQHAGGVDQFVQTMTSRFAEAGFVAISPELYHRDDANTGDDPMTKMSRLRDRNIVQDVDAAIEHVKTLLSFDGNAIGITGFCMGGRVAYLIATERTDLRASVVFWGGNIMRPWGEGRTPFDQTEKIACPVLGLFGEDDPNPNPADVAKIDAELTRFGKPHEFHSYAGAGHAFMVEGRPSHRPEASDDAWRRCVEFFERHLKQR